MKREQLENVGSLITYTSNGVEYCLGDLIWMGGSAFDPDNGLIEGLTEDEVNVHNQTLDIARIQGMDKNCEIGQGSFAYLGRLDGKLCVRTFIGTLVSNHVTITGNKRKTIKFVRNGRTYRGILAHDGDCFNFRRVA